MEVFNKAPPIAEDVVHYHLYLPSDSSSKTSAFSFMACISALVELLLPRFLWHRDAFELKIVPGPEAEGDCWMLEGRMRVGDCIDDEWCVVWLLREISARWDIAIRYCSDTRFAAFLSLTHGCRVFESDGEFLLIEAADVLPSWIQPSNVENRVRILPLKF
jgi:hypothetical protein